MQTLQPLPPPPDPGALEAAVQEALCVLGGGAPDLILVNDPQRATASRDVLDQIRERVDLSRSRLLVATGSHRFTPDEQRKLVQDLPLIPADSLDWHDARRPDLLPIGGSQGWRAHPWVAHAARILAIGSVEPHYFAGFSGAHKTATIGCASLGDITRNHAGALDPACRPCRLAGTPVHEGILGMLSLLEQDRQVAAVNVMQLGAAIVDAAGGTARTALEKLAPNVQAAYMRRIARPASGLVAEVSGPLSCSFYQAEKGIKNSEWAVRDGGVIVLQAACPQGIGQDAFMRLLQLAPTHREAEALVLARGYRLGDHKGVRLRYLTDSACRHVRVFAVSPGLDEADAALLGIRLAGSVDEALRRAGVDPGDPDVYRIEDAANTCVEADGALHAQAINT